VKFIEKPVTANLPDVSETVIEMVPPSAEVPLYVPAA
jgi:hypothetical protein